MTTNLTVSTPTTEQIALLKNTICKGISDQEFEVFLHIANRCGLDPFAKQIYAIKRGNGVTYQTSIDGYRLIADRTGNYSPGRESVYMYNDHGALLSATSFVMKMTKDSKWHEVAATAHWKEYVQAYNGKPSQFWDKMPHVMLAKVAEALALRKAFPADLSGIYIKEEMDQVDSEGTIDITPEPRLIEEKDLSLVALKLKQHKQGADDIYDDGILVTKYLSTIRKFLKVDPQEAFEDIKDSEKFKANFSKWKETQTE